MKTFSAFVAAIFLCSCSPKNLYVGHETVLGLNAKVNQARQQGQLLFGYDRDFATIIPTNVPTQVSGETDAMALVHCTRVITDGIYLGEYRDFTATGEAADLIANDPARVRAATSCDILNKEEG